jgi:hypothetical protein
MTPGKTVTYDPRAHLSEAYPSWWITTADFGTDPRRGDHAICWAGKLIIVDPRRFCDDEPWALAHIAYHLDEHMARLGALSEDDCREADLVALVRLDRPEWRSGLTT